MTINEAIKIRHTVRKYKDKAIPQELIEKLNARIDENNKTYALNLKLVTDNSEGVTGLGKLFLAKNVNNYIILAGTATPDLDEKSGYCGADLILYAQTLGLNTWWIGGMYNKKGVQKYLDLANVRINGIIAIGYGQTQGVPHKSKTAAKISQYQGTAPQWFIDGVEALLYAPTSLNKQAFKVVGDGNKVSISYEKGHFAGINLGIGKYHFEIGAGKENFEWVQLSNESNRT
ncbi:MAG: nitroreductase family protein [Euryarchaeota archaeon]|nr:nitroreductase family protein [Euryarchaeota archaeon]